MKSYKIVVKIDQVKNGREVSRGIFKGVKLGSVAHKNKKAYSRREKHKPAYF